MTMPEPAPRRELRKLVASPAMLAAVQKLGLVEPVVPVAPPHEPPLDPEVVAWRKDRLAQRNALVLALRMLAPE
jgi:hypothetical protein